MKFLCTSDWHLRTTSPRYRTDDYLGTLFDKIKWIFDLAKKERCTAILHGGDVCDSPDQSNTVIVTIIKLCRQYKIPLYVTAGQHDLLYRKFSNTTLAVLVEAGVVTLLNSTPIKHDGNIYIYGASWEEQIPKVEEPDATNLLIIHKMIVQDKPLWAEQVEYTKADTLLKEYTDYKLINSGDNHNSFTYRTTNQTLVNVGSLMRTTIAQKNHTPCTYLYNSETNEVTQHKIPIHPIEEVMNLELADERKERNEALEAFMTGLSSEYKVELSFEDNLTNLMKANNVDREIQGIAYTMIGKYYDANK